MLETIIPWIKYFVLLIGGYLISIILKHILDKNVTKFRLDNYLLYLLMVKTPTAFTKIILKSNKRDNINEIKKRIQREFKLDRNEPVKNNSFIFKIRGHQAPMKIMIIEPDESKLFTITLETIGEDKLPKLLKSSFSDTINYFEKINKSLSHLKFKSINVLINISCYLDDNDKVIYNCDKNISMSPKTISCSSNDFTDIEPLVKKCLGIWRNKFL